MAASQTGETSKDASPPKENISSVEDDASFGYDLYPERRREYSPSWKKVVLGQAGSHIDRMKCEKNVYSCAKNSPLVKLMMSALRSSGCPFDIRRHVACEDCEPTVSGGYDPKLNQIVICQNMARREGTVQGILAHEMIHMFDYCNNKLDFKNVDHLACTEIRAANLTHCSFMSAWAQGDASPFDIKRRHQECVKTKAVASVMAVRNISAKDACAAVERVFEKCYNDLEPIGRRIRRNSYDMQKAYMEAPLYGYE